MKKTLLFFLSVLLVLPLFAGSLSVTADMGSLQDLIIRTNSIQFSTDVRYSFAEKYELKIPLTISLSEGMQLYDVGLFLDYYPIKKQGLFLGLSLIQFGFVNRDFYGLNEISLGWTFKFFKGLMVEPSISIKDPSGSFQDEYELIKGAFPCYRKFRFKLNAGWQFNLGR